MPTYEYACKACGEHLDAVQAFTDDALTTCPRCDGPLRKVYGNIAIAFKGSGFYKTDNRSMGKGSPERPGTADTKSDSDSKSDAGADSGSGSGSDSEKSGSKAESSSGSSSDSSASKAKSNGSESSPSKADKPAKADKSPAAS